MKGSRTGGPVKDKTNLGIRPPNTGIHWEYRVFGVLSEEHHAHMESICSTPLGSGSVKDRYLWSPNCLANIKVRRGKLKFKRLLETTPDGFELWEEGNHLEFDFPLKGPAIEMLEKELRVAVPDVLKSECASADDLVSGMSLFKPALKCITIDKHRTRCLFLCEGAPIRLEIAALSTPAGITSIAVENAPPEGTNGGERLRPIRRARDLLGLPGPFEIMGYMQLLDQLARQVANGPVDRNLM